jgi:Tfp pilus assembly protein PilZ
MNDSTTTSPARTTAPSGRRDKRYRIRMRVLLSLGNQQIELRTGDVSLRGLFVRTDRTLRPRQFIRLDFQVPFGDVPLSLFGSVVHAVAPPGTPERPPGLGIELYGNGPDELKRWQDFITTVERRHPESMEREVDLCEQQAAATPEPIRRRYPRFEAQLQVRGYFGELDDLVLMYTRDISKGGMFVKTNAIVDVGSSVSLQLVHPLTGQQFPVRCVVRRVVVDRERGMGVEFLDMDAQRRRQLWDFISSGVQSVPADDLAVAPPAAAPSAATTTLTSGAQSAATPPGAEAGPGVEVGTRPALAALDASPPVVAAGNSAATSVPSAAIPPATLPTYMAVNVAGRHPTAPAATAAAAVASAYVPPPLPSRRPPFTPPPRGRYP